MQKGILLFVSVDLQIGMRDAYVYLNRYKGIEFLKEFYDVGAHPLI